MGRDFDSLSRQICYIASRVEGIRRPLRLRPLGLIDRAGCFRPLGRPRCLVAGQLAADADMAVRFHVRSITRDALATAIRSISVRHMHKYIVRSRKCSRVYQLFNR